MFLFSSRITIYRLCYIFTVSINFPVVLSDNSQLNKTPTNKYVNLISDKPIMISFNNLSKNKNNSFTLSDEVIENMDVLLPLRTMKVVITDIPSNIHFIITEVHSFLYDVTLGYNPDKVNPQSYVTGTNIGLVNITDESALKSVTLYLENNHENNVTVLIAVMAYNKSAPIPGGCNMEFQTEIAPYLLLNYTESITTVLSQPSALPSTYNKRKSCQIPPGTFLRYETYHMYLPTGDFTGETYFDSVKSMITVDRIMNNGKKMPPSLIGPENKRLFSNYIGTGSVYAVIVSTLSSSGINDDITIASAAYVPAISNPCSPEQSHPNCQILESTYFDFIFVGLLLIGSFLMLLGHLYFKTEMFIYGAITSGTITYLLLVMHGNFSSEVNVALSILSLLIGGMVWVQIWSYFGIPVLSVLLPLLNGGVLMSSVYAYFCSNIYGIQPVLQNDTNFWLAILCVTLSLMLLLISDARDGSIRANAFVGSFMIIVSLDYFIGSNLKYIIVNMYRRLMVPDFTGAIIDPPLQIRDIALSVLWLILIGVGCITQDTLLSGKPPFPPPSNPFRRIGSRYGYRVIPDDSPIQGYSEDSEESVEQVDERTPIYSPR